MIHVILNISIKKKIILYKKNNFILKFNYTPQRVCFKIDISTKKKKIYLVIYF